MEPLGNPGRFTLTLRLIFHLPLRQAEGFLTSLFRLMGLDLPSPDHTTLSRRGQHLDVTLRHPPRDKRLHLIIDSTRLSTFGEGEWAAAKHGGHGKRGWRKLHLGVNRSGVVVAQALTDATTDDAVTGITLLGVEDNVVSVTADPAYDTIAFYDAATEHGAKVVVPPASDTCRVRLCFASSTKPAPARSSTRESGSIGPRRQRLRQILSSLPAIPLQRFPQMAHKGPLNTLFQGVKTVHPPSTIAEGGKTRDKSLEHRRDPQRLSPCQHVRDQRVAQPFLSASRPGVDSLPSNKTAVCLDTGAARQVP